MEATAWTTAVAMAPPLPHEIWNLATILVICALAAWMARLTQLVLTYLDVRYASASDAVLHLHELGPSLMVLRNASMWHLQQLLRTKTEVVSTKMKRVTVPFEVVASSVHIQATKSSADAAARRDLMLTFQCKSTRPCAIQVLWGVRAEAIDPNARINALESAGSTTDVLPPQESRMARFLRRIAIVRPILTVPSVLSRARRQPRRHQLQDDQPSPINSPPSSKQSPSLKETDYQSASPVQKCDETVGAVNMQFVIPSVATECPSEEIESLINECETNSPTHVSMTSSPRFAAVIMLRVLTSDGSSLRANARADDSMVVSQCVAIDFLPTPLKAEKFNPVVVKRINYTKNDAFITQEIFGHNAGTSGECVICLEGELSVVLLPCRHLCVCRVCLDEIDRCPICRAKFSTYVCCASPSDTKEDANDSDDKERMELKVV
ncbi:hypothetical protein Poli38472_004578 [Pythium oligandrum]|uniref:RING-type domain-containing protein n=1 Tax=Pythium oligandrum TaxID=41045 RepID=A0A8K1CAJ8_PYTOL|nr:hypothetical protein Poli38472_004578 [Pythium oligandrum]|eukprot:TMW59509.1 hypothetical protein Poli38472_004578 [Pythium oligandrum]